MYKFWDKDDEFSTTHYGPTLNIDPAVFTYPESAMIVMGEDGVIGSARNFQVKDGEGFCDVSFNEPFFDERALRPMELRLRGVYRNVEQTWDADGKHVILSGELTQLEVINIS